ncbi:SulP family inorganic anion transporter [Spirosoma radiotolerans]|uniref:SLC26A/SulP transporter domain-containing protein n=1 Tax=Spirosoma radiotolerans TaxID=1379870 RepID=A0A0E3ZWE4_9BACT|nr:SulP family inorganic anion transporter [Spirosoma radiotolerans]AKD55620.1 hypothetical protein SD10_12655 [Spirosoma radiotolerans]
MVLFSGSERPVAGLAAIVSDSVAKVGSYEVFLMAVMLAGLIQLGLSLVKASRFSSFFPGSVVKGVLVTFGIAIILKQNPYALDRDNDHAGMLEFQQPTRTESTIIP